MPIVGPAGFPQCGQFIPPNETSEVRRGDGSDGNIPTIESGAACRVVSVTAIPVRNRHLFGVPFKLEEKEMVVMRLESVGPLGIASVSLSVSIDGSGPRYNVGDFVALKLIPVDDKKVLPPFRNKRLGES